MTDPILTNYQLKIWKRNMPSIIRQLRRECLVAMSIPYVLCTHVQNEPIWRSE